MARRTDQSARLRALTSVIEAQHEVMALGHDPERVMPVIAHRAQVMTDADSGVVELVDGDEMVYRAVAGGATGLVGLRLAIATSLSGLCVRTGEILRCEDTDTDDRVDREACRRVGARSMIVVPLRHDRVAVGVLKVTSARPGAFTDTHVDALELVAGFVSAALVHAADKLALQASEERFRLTFDMAPIGMALVGLTGHWLRVNRAMCDVVGYTPEELIALTFQDLTHPDDLAIDLALVEQLLRGEIPRYSLAKRYFHKAGQVVHVMLHVSLVRDGAGQPLHFVSQVEDVTERKAIEARLQLGDRMASIGTLAAGVAHEINNPLAYIMSNLDMIVGELGELGGLPGGAPAGRLKDLAELASEARTGAERVRKIVRGLKAFSRTDQEQIGPHDVRVILETAINMSFNEIRHRARLVKELGAVPVVEVDEARLGQVFINLLVNAAQALPEGHADRNEIRVTTLTAADGRAVIEVQDTGPGIAPEVMGRIFDPFFTTKPVGVGTGLGLSVCHGIVGDLGGEITVESRLGHGSTFRVTLPAALVPPAANPSSPAAPRRRVDGRARVLVIDDDPVVGTSLARVLKAHDVTVVRGGADALAWLARTPDVDVILCDLMMPVMSGMEVHAELARTFPPLTERMVFMTGGAFTAAAGRFLDEVPNERVDKPFDLRSLRLLVERFMRHRA